MRSSRGSRARLKLEDRATQWALEGDIWEVEGVHGHVRQACLGGMKQRLTKKIKQQTNRWRECTLNDGHFSLKTGNEEGHDGENEDEVMMTGHIGGWRVEAGNRGQICPRRMVAQEGVRTKTKRKKMRKRTHSKKKRRKKKKLGDEEGRVSWRVEWEMVAMTTSIPCLAIK